MVDFSVPNLCGASLELNDVLSKLADAKADAKAKLNETASTAAAAFDETQNELAGLKDKLQSIEIPTLPKLNLQSEITSLLSQVPGSVGYAVALAKITLEFKDDIENKGLTLETLVSAAAVSSDLICSVVPNLEKDSGSTEPAVEKPVAVKQAAVAAIAEDVSVVKQNENVETKVIENKEKTEAYKVGTTPPTSDTGAFTVATETKKISVKSTSKSSKEIKSSGQNSYSSTTSSKESTTTVETEVTPKGSSNNIAAKGTGHTHKKVTVTERIKFADLKISGDDIQFTKLKHKPVHIISAYVYPSNPDSLLKTPDDFSEKFPLLEGLVPKDFGSYKNQEYRALRAVWRRAGKPPYYDSWLGPHMVEILEGGSDAGGFSARISADQTVVTIDSDDRPTGNHPGNIIAEESLSFILGKVKKHVRVITFRNRDGKRRTNHIYNKKYKGYAAQITYDYLDNYDADVEDE